MKIVRNLTRRPLRVPLPRGRLLHLGPRAEGRVTPQAIDTPGLQRLVEAGELEIVGDGAAPSAPPPGAAGAAHPEAHGHHPEVSVPTRGNR